MQAGNRREFMKTLATTSAGWSLATMAGSSCSGPGSQSDLHLAPFRFDVTPPIGHSCCGGWIKPVEAVDDPLEALGFVLLGAGDPIVICAVDWTGLLNDAHVQWRAALAKEGRRRVVESLSWPRVAAATADVYAEIAAGAGGARAGA